MSNSGMPFESIVMLIAGGVLALLLRSVLYILWNFWMHRNPLTKDQLADIYRRIHGYEYNTRSEHRVGTEGVERRVLHAVKTICEESRPQEKAITVNKEIFAKKE